MRVIDASVVVNALLGRNDRIMIDADDLAAPHLVDSEVVNGLRQMVRRGDLPSGEGDRAFEAFTRLALTRYPVTGVLGRVWELRHNLSGYDASFVALAEALDATLLTGDAKLAAAPGIRCPVELVA
ncbi:MAG: type II toxin-antitoxin system VapC family toxin [Gordonia sp. (in: high G+C Gram-positive bacteria)]|uniref:type II toxin-antitoxin system VapC family toxin n=1 Tax=Gordonia sp. (in: high G+C Gram-positive bacteria) TaxID=84139 RepID=UPI0039E71924